MNKVRILTVLCASLLFVLPSAPADEIRSDEAWEEIRQALVLYQQEKYVEAFSRFDGAVKRFNLAEEHKNDASFHKSYFEFAFEAEEWETALRECNLVIGMDPECESEYLSLSGKLSARLGDFATAERMFTRYIAAAPNDAEGYSNRAYSRFNLGNLDAALSDAKKSLEMEPSFIAYAVCGEVYFQKKEYGTALQYITASIPLAEDGRADAILKHGETYMAMGRYASALPDFDEFIRMKPGTAVGYQRRAAAESALGDYDAAIADYTEMLRLESDNAEAYMLRGWMYQCKGKKSRALSDVNRALRLEPDSTEALVARARIYQRQGKEKKARADLARVESLAEETPHYYLIRGLLHLELGDKEQAISDLTRSLELEPGDIDATEYLRRAKALP